MSTYEVKSIPDRTNWNIWLEGLAHTHLSQAQHTLCDADDGEVLDLSPKNKTEFSYCCLGFGELLIPDGFELLRKKDNLAHPEFIAWLGFEFDEDVDSELRQFDLVPDWPSDLTVQGYKDQYTEDGWRPAMGEDLTAASMNDDDFTFAQIADVFRYFGVKEVNAS